MSEPKSLIEYVQAHERMWGLETYQNRPEMQVILSSAVVAFWIDSNLANGKKHIITVHDDLKPIQAYFDTFVRRLRIGFSSRRLVILFVNGCEVEVGIRIGVRQLKHRA